MSLGEEKTARQIDHQRRRERQMSVGRTVLSATSFLSMFKKGSVHEIPWHGNNRAKKGRLISDVLCLPTRTKQDIMESKRVGSYLTPSACVAVRPLMKLVFPADRHERASARARAWTTPVDVRSARMKSSFVGVLRGGPIFCASRSLPANSSSFVR